MGEESNNAELLVSMCNSELSNLNNQTHTHTTERNPNIILKIVLTSQMKGIKGEERNTEEIKEGF